MDIDDSWLGLAVAILSAVLLALISAAEGGIVALKARKEEHSFGGRVDSPAFGLTEKEVQTINGLLVAKTIVAVFTLSALLWVGLSYGFHWAVILLLILATLLLLAFSHSLSLLLAFRQPDALTMLTGPFATVLAYLVWPVHLPAQLLYNAIVSAVASKEAVEGPDAWPVEKENGSAIERDESQMVRGIIRLEETMAREVMVPRIDIVGVEVDTPLSQVVQTIVERGYSRIPVFEETIDNVVGILYAKDLLRSFGSGSPSPSLQSLLRPAHFIPENKKIGELLTELRQKRVHIAIVVDEYGGTAGLVTIEDLLEEIVGEIEDEYDPQEVQIEQVGEDDYIVDARVDIDQLNDMLGLNIQKEDFDTVGGYVYSLLGKIPSTGDDVSANGLTISVLSTTGHRIKKVRVTYHKAQERAER